MKKCSICKEYKNINEFYKNKHTHDGLRCECKECHKNNEKIRYIKIADKLSIYYKKRYIENKEYILERNKKYRKTTQGRESQKKADLKQKQKNLYKIRSRKKVYQAIKQGKIIKPNNCELCGIIGKIEGHHYDYNHPLDVIWLCEQCHKQHHNSTGTTGSINIKINL